MTGAFVLPPVDASVHEAVAELCAPGARTTSREGKSTIEAQYTRREK